VCVGVSRQLSGRSRLSAGTVLYPLREYIHGMTTWIMFDNDVSAHGVKRRIHEEMARKGILSDSHAARLFGKHPQQWVSRRMTGEADWRLQELCDFCGALSLDYIYVTTGIRTINPDGGGGNQSRLGESNSRPIHYRPSNSRRTVHTCNQLLRRAS